MYSGNPELSSHDPVRSLKADLEHDIQADAHDSWIVYCRDHIAPHRLIEIAVEGSEASPEELTHIEFCDNCRKHFDDYLAMSSGPAVERSLSSPDVAGSESRILALSQSAASWSSCAEIPAKCETPGTGIPDIVRESFLFSTPVLFPTGDVGLHAWQFGTSEALSASDRNRAEKAMAICSDRLFDALVNDIRPDLSRLMLVCFGEAMHHCGVELAARVVDRVGKAPHVVLAHDYYEPKLICHPSEFHEAEVVVLVDVIHSGSLIRRLIELCATCRPSSINGLALIDESSLDFNEMQVVSAWHGKGSHRESLDTYRANSSSACPDWLRMFDPNRSCSLSVSPASPHELDSSNSSADSTAIEAELQEWIAKTGAMKMDYTICGKQYAFAVNVLDLLRKDEGARDFVLRRAGQVLADCGFSRTCLAYHAGRSQRAGVIAKAIGSFLGWPVMAIGSKGDAFALTDDQARKCASFDNIVIVDAAIRTGESIAAIVQAIADQRMSREPRIIGFAVLNSLADVELQILAQSLSVELRAGFCLPLAPPSVEIRHWSKMQKAAIGEELLKENVPTVVRDTLWDYCFPKSQGFSKDKVLTSDEVKDIIHLAVCHAKHSIPAAASISAACSNRSARSIRHLEVDTVANDRTSQELLRGIMFNSMNPQMKESAAIALAAAQRYDWLSMNWLKVNEPFLSSSGQAWKCIVLIEQLMRKGGHNSELEAFGRVAKQYLEHRKETREKLKPPYTQTLLFEDVADSLNSECSADVLIVNRVSTYVEAAEG